MILAQALYNGPKFVKKVVMEMAGSRMFPTDSITDAMADMQHVIQTEAAPAKTSDPVANNMCFPVMSVTKIQRLDDIIKELKVPLRNLFEFHNHFYLLIIIFKGSYRLEEILKYINIKRYGTVRI